MPFRLSFLSLFSTNLNPLINDEVRKVWSHFTAKISVVIRTNLLFWKYINLRYMYYMTTQSVVTVHIYKHITATTNFISKIHKMHVISNLLFNPKQFIQLHVLYRQIHIITNHKNTKNMNIKIFKFYRFTVQYR